MFKAAVLREDSKLLSFEELSKPIVRDDEVLVAVVASGVCHSDLTFLDGHIPVDKPITLGHEGSGIVRAVGKRVTSVKIGDHVVMSYLACGTCPSCLVGKGCYCHNFYTSNLTGRRLDGSSAWCTLKGEAIAGHFFGQSSFATFSVANERNVVKVSKRAPLALLAPLGCGVQTGAGTVMNVFQPTPADPIGIFGAGGVGLSAVMAAAALECSCVVVVEPNEARRTLALELGATYVIDPAAGNVVEQILDRVPGGLLFAMDTSGIPAVLRQAIDVLAPRGQLAVLTVASHDAVLELPLSSLLGKGQSIRGIIEGESTPQHFIPELVELIINKRFPLDKIVRYYDLDQIDQAIDDQRALRAVKPIIRMPAQP